MVKLVQIGARKVGDGEPCYIIAEAGVNHNGDAAMAKRLIEAAARVGADAVKFQSFKAEKLVTSEAPKAEYQKKADRSFETQFEMLARLQLTHEMHLQLMDSCQEVGIQFLSSPFDEGTADELVTLGLPALKIASSEITNLPFLKHIARSKLPVILSTGMASLGEVGQAVELFRSLGNTDLVLLHCVSNYPARPTDCNLRAMETMRAAFGLPVGYSDHTLGNEIAFAAVARGACMIEKHLTLDHSLPGPDHQASAEPEEFTKLVRGIRDIEVSLGSGRKSRCAAEEETARVVRRSIVASRDIAGGSVITSDMLTLQRPGTGLPPSFLKQLSGRKASCFIPRGKLISWELLA